MSEPAFGGWRPISTLPKDGKTVMLYRPLAGESNDPVITIRRTTKTSQHCWPDTIPPGCDGQNFTEGACYATHWMPLPKPPSPTPAPSLGGEGREGAMPEVYVSPEAAKAGAAPEWDLAGRVHDWRNHVHEDVQRIWHTFTPEQRAAIVTWADDLAGREEWE